MLADALSRRLDYELAHATTLSSPMEELIRVAYPRDYQCVALFHDLGSEVYGVALFHDLGSEVYERLGQSFVGLVACQPSSMFHR